MLPTVLRHSPHICAARAARAAAPLIFPLPKFSSPYFSPPFCTKNRRILCSAFPASIVQQARRNRVLRAASTEKSRSSCSQHGEIASIVQRARRMLLFPASRQNARQTARQTARTIAAQRSFPSICLPDSSIDAVSSASFPKRTTKCTRKACCSSGVCRFPARPGVPHLPALPPALVNRVLKVQKCERGEVVAQKWWCAPEKNVFFEIEVLQV
jgi:hypothetical protein